MQIMLNTMSDTVEKKQFSEAMINALNDLERIEFDFTVKVAEGISCKGTIFVRRNPVDGEG